MNDLCSSHEKEITHICRHPNCLKFTPLCEVCYDIHLKHHQDSKLPVDTIYTVEVCINDTRVILERIKDDLERTQNRAATELTTSVPSNIDEVLIEVESIRHQINKLFDRYVQGLKDKFESKIKSRIFAVYDEIKMNIEIVKDFIKQITQHKVLRIFAQNDMEYQAQYQKSHLENLITQRANQKFEGRIDDDIALHFIGVIQKELDNLLVYDQPKQTSKVRVPSKVDITSPENKMQKSLQTKQRGSSKGFQSYATVNLEAASIYDNKQSEIQGIHKNWLFYFEPGTKNFYFMDVVKSKNNPVFQVTEIETDLLFTKGARSILAQDGFIYYVCGYEEKEYSEKNEDQLKTIYQLSFEGKPRLKPVARMVTLRNHFSLCCTQEQEIYIIGGENHKEGCLPKCEKLSLKNSQITIINHLMEYSAYHTCSLYNNQYIFKIGGCRMKFHDRKQPCRVLVCLYNIERDVWSSIQFPMEVQLPKDTYLSFSIQVNENSIFVFGGLDEYEKLTTQAYLLIVEEEEEFDQKDNLRKSLGFVFKLNYNVMKVGGYSANAPLLIQSQNQHQIFALLFQDNECKLKQVWVFDKRWRELQQ